MEKLKQNNLEEATTDIGFVKAINKNAEELGTDKVALVREVEIEDGVKVNVEGITPHKMKTVLNQQITATGDVSSITFKTPGEPVQVYTNGNEIGPVETQLLDGVVQTYNKNMDKNLSSLEVMSLDINPEITSLEITPVDDLKVPVAANTVVANLTTQGGTSPYIYSLKPDTEDNSEFVIENDTVKTALDIDFEVTKNITVIVTDANNMTKEQTAQIIVNNAE